MWDKKISLHDELQYILIPAWFILKLPGSVNSDILIIILILK
jgi:hypothetical protein